jgi:hypothetical protein
MLPLNTYRPCSSLSVWEDNIVRRAALRMALVRALVKASQIVMRDRTSLMTGLSIAEIFDKAMQESEEASP